LVRVAIARLDSHERISILELCELARSMDMGNLQQTTREVINETIGAEEERAWMTWWAKRPQQEVTSMHQYAASQRAVLTELARLQAAGAEVSSPEVQQLVGQFMANLQRYGVRESLVDALSWNAGLTRKWLAIGERVTARTLADQLSATQQSDTQRSAP